MSKKATIRNWLPSSLSFILGLGIGWFLSAGSVPNPHHELYIFFATYWDDHIVAPTESRVLVNGRTLQVLISRYGQEVVRESLEAWAEDGDINIISDGINDPEAGAVEILDYVEEKPELKKKFPSKWTVSERILRQIEELYLSVSGKWVKKRGHHY